MLSTDVLFAGLGGHGMLLAGKLLAHAAVNCGKQVSWLPAYGAEMRGGTANATVCISDESVTSPYIERPQTLVAMNTACLLKYAPLVRVGGLIVINTTLARDPFERLDCDLLPLPATDMAIDMKAPKSANLVLLGAWAGFMRRVAFQKIVETIEGQFSLKHAVMTANVAAFTAGYRHGSDARAHLSKNTSRSPLVQEEMHAHHNTRTT